MRVRGYSLSLIITYEHNMPNISECFELIMDRFIHGNWLWIRHNSAGKLVVCVTLVSATWWHKSMTDIYGDSFFVAVQPFINGHHQKTLIINGASIKVTDLGNEACIFFILDFQSSQKIGDDKILLQNIMSTEYIFLQSSLREWRLAHKFMNIWSFAHLMALDEDWCRGLGLVVSIQYNLKSANFYKNKEYPALLSLK